MIWHPKPGQRVQIRYGKQWRKRPELARLHEQTGTVLVAARGPGAINALVQLDQGGRKVVPRGNLFDWSRGLRDALRKEAKGE